MVNRFKKRFGYNIEKLYKLKFSKSKINLKDLKLSNWEVLSLVFIFHYDIILLLLSEEYKMSTQKEEKEFLKKYDSSQFEKLSITSDIVVFSVSDTPTDNYRKLNTKDFSILLIQRDDFPFKGNWALPGGFVDVKESIDDATDRILKLETGLTKIYKEQLYTFGDVNRDPRMRIVSISHLSLIDKSKIKDKLSDNAKWFNIYTSESDNLLKLSLKSNNVSLTIVAKKVNDTYQVIESKNIAFDHAQIILLGLLRLRNKINYTDIVFNLMPEYFTLTELQTIYELILGKKLLTPAFRRVISEKVEKTDKMLFGAGHRPSCLFKYKK